MVMHMPDWRIRTPNRRGLWGGCQGYAAMEVLWKEGSLHTCMQKEGFLRKLAQDCQS